MYKLKNEYLVSRKRQVYGYSFLLFVGAVLFFDNDHVLVFKAFHYVFSGAILCVAVFACRDFAVNSLPQLEASFIDIKKDKIIFRHPDNYSKLKQYEIEIPYLDILKKQFSESPNGINTIVLEKLDHSKVELTGFEESEAIFQQIKTRSEMPPCVR